ncbi:helix-turn-helix transcriptional regulator [Fructobacillus cardui]|uniref:helix-turn-helix domain-containing protein n=1 Tax=Fructobacillus cardui TaxID=2893170 RepID=UPI002D85812A|nr:Transcriptional regulator [Fructobacillus cardui]
MSKNRLKELRKEKKLSLVSIEKQTGIKRSTFSDYENGKTEPKLATWEKLAKFYGVTPAYLVGWED